MVSYIIGKLKKDVYEMIRVLFVCLGNICRSPMAEALFKDLVKREGLEDQIKSDSAGTGDWHVGEPPHEGTLKILEKYEIDATGLVGRQLTVDDFEAFDYIVAMDESNIDNLYRMLNKPKHPKVMRLLDLTDEPKDVPDPYYTGNFEETYELVTNGCQALLEKIKKERL
ncbi:Low molecular weight protein tyrosine phosphatase [Bacillus thermotolerans]|nr:Low molecular weight protein tyrosine phosphatase [Bacillus thermotolerans]